jgi:MFS family permease
MTGRDKSGDAIVSRVPFFYGWVMLPVAMVIQVATSPGQTHGVSVFNPSLRESLNLSHSELTGAYMVGTMLASVPMVAVGSLMDRYGPRLVLALVTSLFCIACAAFSQVSGLVTLFLGFMFLRMLAQGSMSLLAQNTLAMWFNRRLGLASGIKSMGMAFGLGVIPPFHLWLIQSYGWRTAYVILGGMVALSVLPLLAVVYRNRPEDVGQVPDGAPKIRLSKGHGGDAEEVNATLREAMRTRAFWILAGCMASWSAIGTGITFNIVPLFLDHGFQEADAALMFTTLAVASGVSMLVGGLLADRFRLNLLLSLSMAGMAISIGQLMVMTTSLDVHLFATGMGLSQGLMMSVGSTVWVRYYGRRHLGKIRGSLTTVGVGASSLGPFLMGAAYDLTGGYAEILWVFLSVYAPLAVVALFATPPRKSDGGPGTA